MDGCPVSADFRGEEVGSEKMFRAAYRRDQRMRLLIQIIVVLEILISCIPRSEVLILAQWANQPSRTP
jgi:hypothetical protein